MKNLVSKIVASHLILVGFITAAFAQGLPTAKPEAVQMSSERLNQIDGLVEKAIAEKKMPGAVVLVGRKGKIIFKRAYGDSSLKPQIRKMTTDTIFDLASLTKPVATATSIMMLVEQGKIRLNDTIGDFISDIDDENAKKVTVRQLLTHTSGYRPDFDLRERWEGREGMLAALKKEKLRNAPGAKFVYSDIGFIVLGEIVSRVSKMGAEKFFNEIAYPLKMNNSTFFTGADKTFKVTITASNEKMPFEFEDYFRIAPTENVREQQRYLGGIFQGTDADGDRILRGQVHDPTSYRMGGVAGHAGLFSIADDLARYCQMLLNGGSIDGKRVLSPATVALMIKPNVVSEKGDTRALGWDINTSFSSVRGELFPLGTFGHTGFTGTGIWIDPLSETFVIFLSNRVHPDGKGNIVDVRARISTVAASAIMDVTPEQIKNFEAKYYAEINSQLSAWKNRSEPRELAGGSNVGTLNVVLNGIDVLEKENFKPLNGMKVGLVTNHTGRNLAGKTTIDILNEANNLKLISLFSPEHGIRGELDQSKINDSIDQKTSLPIYSLYGESRRPRAEQLENLDALAFDIQDIGTRFYTYISTLRFVLEEAAKANKKVFVLDRPNPINGVDVAGAIADEDKLSFVATHTLPVRHGMTIGEIALMMNKERGINADLEIVKMQNWKRSMWFDETGQTWVNPSPNMRNLTQASLYPGIGLLETTNLSVGRGTDTPFEIVGAPWIDGQKLASFLNARNLEGVRFVSVSFTPKSSVFAAKRCAGVNIIVTDRKSFAPLKTGVEIALALRKLFPDGWQMDKYNRLLVNTETFENIRAGKTYEEIMLGWEPKLSSFKNRKSTFFLYK